MEAQTATPTPDLRNRIITLTLRIAVLTLDIATLTTLSVSLNIYSKWIPSISYPTTALQPITNTDKTDWIVLAAIVISLVWTTFITIRLAFTRRAPAPVFTAVFEPVCLVWLIACIIPAFVLRESSLGNLAAISNTCDEENKVAMTLTGGGEVKWVCMPHLNTLKKVQVAAYSVACVVAFLHLTLSALACRSIMQQRSRDRLSPLMAAAQHIEKDTTAPQHNHEEFTTNESNRRSESVYSSSSTQHQHLRIEVSEF